MTIIINAEMHDSGPISAAATRRALELNLEALDVAGKAVKVKESKDPEEAARLLTALSKNIDAKAALVCDVFHGAFPAETLMEQISNAELNELIKNIAMAKD